MDEGTVAALRTADPALADQVLALAELVGVTVLVRPPGTAPPPARVLLDDVAAGPPWARSAVRITGDDGGVAAGRGDGDAEPAALALPRDAERLLELLVSGPPRARVVGVLGAHGGIGTTTLACVLARAAVAAGTSTCLVGLDPAGGPDGLLGLGPTPGTRWADLDRHDGVHVPARLMSSLPRWRGVAVLGGDERGGPEPAVALAVLDALAQASDLVVLDLPRHALQAPALVRRCRDVVLLTGCDERATETVATVRTLRAHGLEPHLVVRRRGAGTPEVGRLAEACGSDVAVVLREERSLRAALSRGLTPGDQGRGPLVAAARALLRRLEEPR